MKSLISRSQMLFSAVFSAVFGMFGMALASPTIDDLWTACDVTTINGKVLAILTVFVSINLGFLAYRLIRRTMSKG